MGQDDTTMSIPGRVLVRNLASYITETPKGGVLKVRKYSPENLIKFLNQLSRIPRVKDACRFAGFSYESFRYYLAKSEKGQPGDGFDLTYGEETKRFHLHYADVIDGGIQGIEDELKWRALKGHYQTLHDKGRVIYQVDEELAGLGLTGPDAYLRDEDNNPIPERIHLQDPEVMLAVLRAFRRDRWGLKEQHDVLVRGGVMVVDMRAKNSKVVEEGEKEVLNTPLDVEFREVEDE